MGADVSFVSFAFCWLGMELFGNLAVSYIQPLKWMYCLEGTNIPVGHLRLFCVSES